MRTPARSPSPQLGLAWSCVWLPSPGPSWSRGSDLPKPAQALQVHFRGVALGLDPFMCYIGLWPGLPTAPWWESGCPRGGRARTWAEEGPPGKAPDSSHSRPLPAQMHLSPEASGPLGYRARSGIVTATAEPGQLWPKVPKQAACIIKNSKSFSITTLGVVGVVVDGVPQCCPWASPVATAGCQSGSLWGAFLQLFLES